MKGKRKTVISGSDESKRDRFVRIAEQRVNKILDQFRKLANLSNARNYDYNSDDVKKIFIKLNKELNNIKKKFNQNKKTKEKFKL